MIDRLPLSKKKVPVLETELCKEGKSEKEIERLARQMRMPDYLRLDSERPAPKQ